MFDLDEFIGSCEEAVAGSEPRGAIREVLERAVAIPNTVADVLQPTDAGFTLLHHRPHLTILHVVWAPKMRIYPHNHEMWAAIGIYTGAEDNEFYRRSGPGERTLVESGGKRLEDGDTVLLGAETIHAVTNPRDVLTAAIHIYGGDFVNEPRSQWGPGPREERPYDVAATQREFAAANAAWQAAGEAVP
jgi:predicted metal-dependent enzyme (double-stranded beta helix superfamily)